MPFIRVGVLIAVLGMFAFLALRSSPYLMEIRWMPHWLGALADEYGVIRNIPAFAVLFIISSLCVDWRFRYHVLCGLCILGAAFEIAQIWMPTRYPGWDDVLASWAGVALGYAAVWTVKRCCADVRRRMADGRSE